MLRRLTLLLLFLLLPCLFYYPDWGNTKDGELQPGCPQPLEWHVVAGWLNQPVAHIDYVKP